MAGEPTAGCRNRPAAGQNDAPGNIGRVTAERPGTADASGTTTERRLDGALGLNAWLVEELFRSYRDDPSSVSESWREFFADYTSSLAASAPGGDAEAAAAVATSPGEAGPGEAGPGEGGPGEGGPGEAGPGEGGPGEGAPGDVAVRAGRPGADAPGAGALGAGAPDGVQPPAAAVPAGAAQDDGRAGGRTVAGGPQAGAAATPGAAVPSPGAPTPLPRPAGGAAPNGAAAAPASAGDGDVVAPLRGAAGRLVANMTASLSVPTATSVHPVPAKLLEVNRGLINEHLARRFGGKVSFTHLIGWAVVRGLQAVPAMNASFVADADGRGTPGVRRHAHVGLGVATDLLRADGSRSLVVPVLKQADTLDFSGFFHAYEDLVRRARSSKLAVEDFAGGTVTLTNPGTLGTSQSVPRLMAGQGLIVGVGALGYPPELSSADPATLAELGIGKAVTLTSTYDHRIIQGAESGLFLTYVHELLEGKHAFYDEVFESLGVPMQPARAERDRHPSSPLERERAALEKQVQVQALVNMYRVRGHLIAQLNPLATTAPSLRPDLDPGTYGLTVWDLDRQFLTGGLAGRDVMTLGEILQVLRDAYCRTIGIEYMHIQEPEEKRWVQRAVEGVPTSLSPEEQFHVLRRLNAAEAFERFLHSRYVGQKRFGLEGAESAIAFLDAALDEAVRTGVEEAV
jgi:2-oxoglutarate decarboxylase